MTLIRAKIKTGIVEERVVWNQETNMLNISITDQSISGIANNHITEYLSEILELPKGKISVVKGLDTAYKIIEIDKSLNDLKEQILKYNSKDQLI